MSAPPTPIAQTIARSTTTPPTRPDHGPCRYRTVERSHATSAYVHDLRPAHDYADARAVHRHGRVHAHASVLEPIAPRGPPRETRAWRRRRTRPPAQRVQESTREASIPPPRPATTPPYAQLPS